MSSWFLRTVLPPCSRPGLVALCLLCLTGLSARAQYSFTRIADSSGPLGVVYPPVIGDDGTIAFMTDVDSGGQALYRYKQGDLKQVADTTNSYSALMDVAINNKGSIVFMAALQGGGQGHFLASGGSITPIVDTLTGGFTQVYPGPSINDKGIVAFGAGRPGGQAAQDARLYTYANGVQTPQLDPQTVNGFTAGVVINNQDEILFQGSLVLAGSQHEGLFTVKNGVVKTIVDFSGPLLNTATLPRDLNDAGMAAFYGVEDNFRQGIYMGNGGPLTTVVTTDGPLNTFGYLALNNSGKLVYNAYYDDFTSAVFDGPDIVKNRVIGSGDPLDGTTVLYTGFWGADSLNNQGSFVFGAVLADGRFAIYRADPTTGSTSVPEPGAMALLIGAGVGGFGWLLRRRA